MVSSALDREADEGNKALVHSESFELGTGAHDIQSDYRFYPMSALEILRETVRILRYNSSGFMAIAALLICPVSAVFLSNVLVDESLVGRLALRLLLVARSSGLPLKPFVKQSCHRLSETVVSIAMCFPLFITLLLLSKAAVVHSVDCTYSRKKFDSSRCYLLIKKIWKRVVLTYLWACLTVSSCVALLIVVMVVITSIVSMMGFQLDLVIYPGIVVGLMFSIIIANAIIICNTAVVLSVLEDVSGAQALLMSSSLIRGQIQVGLMIFLGSTMGMALIEGLYEHRVNTISYGDGSSRIWEGPLLVVMYSFVELIDSMMSTVFYFSCKSYRFEAVNVEEPEVEQF